MSWFGPAYRSRGRSCISLMQTLTRFSLIVPKLTRNKSRRNWCDILLKNILIKNIATLWKNNFTIYMYFHKDDAALIWKRYTVIISRVDGLSNGCTLAAHLANILDGRPRLEKSHPLFYTFLSRFSVSLICMKMEMWI